MTDADWGDVFVMDGSRVTSEGNGMKTRRRVFHNASPQSACVPKWSAWRQDPFIALPELSGDLPRIDPL